MASKSDAERAADAAVDFIERFLDAADLDGDLDYGVEEGRPYVNLPDTCAHLIGENGQGVDALQTLTRLAVRQQGTFDSPAVTVDIAGFREKQRQAIIAEVEPIIQAVSESGTESILRPMNPFERAIVHSCVAGHESVESESVGMPPVRSVKIYPAR